MPLPNTLPHHFSRCPPHCVLLPFFAALRPLKHSESKEGKDTWCLRLCICVFVRLCVGGWGGLLLVGVIITLHCCPEAPSPEEQPRFPPVEMAEKPRSPLLSQDANMIEA